ncbi:MAG: Rho termination factor N-terminal domain-containing protein [bacterium]
MLYKNKKTGHIWAVEDKELLSRIISETIQNEAGEPELAFEPVIPKETAASTDAAQLESMTVEALKDYAREKGIELGAAAKKADIIAAIENADKL